MAGLQAAVCLVWLSVYLGIILPSIEHSYAASENLTHLIAFTAYIAQPWSWLLAILCVLRLRHFFQNKTSIDAIWNSALISAVVYAAAIITLRFPIPYYMAPSAFMTWLYFLNLVRIHKTKLLLP